MSEIAIYADSKGQGRCRSCGAVIEWAETTNGKRMPFEGSIVVARSQGNPITGRVVEFIDTSVSPTHWERCPDAQDWKRKR